MSRLKTHAFHTLAALAAGDSHGSAIARWVRDQTGGIRLWPVTLYRTLDELAEAGLIAEVVDDDGRPEGASRRRRYYRLTPEGASVLSAEAERRGAIVDGALRNLADGSWRR